MFKHPIFNKNYTFKDFYFMNSYLLFEEKIPITFNARNIRYKMFYNFTEFIDEDKFFINQFKGDDLNIYVDFNSNLPLDGYSLDISRTNQIKIKANNYRAVRYAFKALNDLVIIKDGVAKIPICRIEDSPSFEIRGVIEGFYGPTYTHENRLDLLSFMDEMKLNSYMYAPKIDIYHRNQWYLLYPEKELNEFKELVIKAQEYDIDIYYTISPGYKTENEPGFQYIDDNDFIRLFNKLDQLIGAGVKHFGLLLDDIDYQLSLENKLVFERPGKAHAYITNRVNRYLKEKVKDMKFVMCPTEYHQIGQTEYRNDLKKYMDEDVFVYWTGDHVCAEVITEKDASDTKEAFGHELFIWDNFPVTDFTYGVRQYMAPIINRTDNLSKYAKGYFSNPMTHYYISKIGIITMAHYAWNSKKYDSGISFEIALRYFGDDFYEKGLDYILFNYPSTISHGNLFNEYEMIEKNDNQAIKNYYKNVIKSAKSLLKLKSPIITELKPWLERVILEEKIVADILEQKITEETLKKFLENTYFSGSEIVDVLIRKNNLLSDEDYQALIKKRRGYPWYRVWEKRR